MSNTLPENWFEITPTCYEFLHGKCGDNTYLKTAVVKLVGNAIEVDIDCFTGGYADRAASLSLEIPIEIIGSILTARAERT
jgi:hypothetical protein